MIRFYLIIVLFLISLLSFLKAPEYYLWQLAVAVTEFPLIFAGITAFLTLTGFWVQKYQLAGTVLGLVTIGIFFSPIVRAWWVAKDIKQDMAVALDTKPGEDAPLHFLKLFSSAKNIAYHDLIYVTYADTSLSLDFYPSQIAGKRPCVIVVHGGSWANGDSKQVPELNGYLAAKGYNVAAINYRMAPKYQSPAPVEDIHATMAYMREHADELNIDTNNFALIGRSAGAQITLLAAYTLHDKALKGVIDFYGPADMVWGYSIPSNPWIMDSRKVMDDYIGGSFKQVPQKYYACSPLEFVNEASIPTLMIHGNNDVLVSPEHTRKLTEKLEKYHIKHYWLKLPWATHGFDFNLNGPGGQLSTYAVETFLNAVTKASPQPLSP